MKGLAVDGYRSLRSEFHVTTVSALSTVSTLPGIRAVSTLSAVSADALPVLLLPSSSGCRPGANNRYSDWWNHDYISAATTSTASSTADCLGRLAAADYSSGRCDRRVLISNRANRS